MRQAGKNDSPTVVVLTAHFPPGVKSGGPVRSLGNMVKGLSGEFRIRVITRDRDHGDNQPYATVRRDQWIRWNGAAVYYASSRTSVLGAARSVTKKHPRHLVYFNSLFHPRFTILPLVARRIGLFKTERVLIAPRGEVTPGALAIRRPKKMLYLRVARLLGLHKGVSWHATTVDEEGHIRDTLDMQGEVFVATNIVELGEEPPALAPNEMAAVRRPLKVAFLSRISEKKNLELAFQVLQQVRVPVRFSVFGPIEDRDYWGRCLRLAKDLPEFVEFSYEGVVTPEGVRPTLESAHVLFLPSTAENFGHVIAEALAAGTPVILSDQTPWRDLVRLGIGWDISLDDASAFARAIEECSEMSPDRYVEMRKSARRYAVERLATEPTDATRRLLKAAIG